MFAKLKEQAAAQAEKLKEQAAAQAGKAIAQAGTNCCGRERVTQSFDGMRRQLEKGSVESTTWGGKLFTPRSARRTRRSHIKSELLIHANQQPHRSAARPPSPRLPLADPRHVITQVSSTTTLENA